ncbi:hypothetical protein NITLEN_90117 [Nitrospira lenta]|uniref:Uncharacterized protein n=1 Tax=Nitrospira lenta TaxID=1436998 RepID=A0A330L9X2_9BACT|nr:hypothetical protein NITLEN_90117 [Nitrospira lenta]
MHSIHSAHDGNTHPAKNHTYTIHTHVLSY